MKKMAETSKEDQSQGSYRNFEGIKRKPFFDREESHPKFMRTRKRIDFDQI